MMKQTETLSPELERFRDENDIQEWMDHVRAEAKRLFSLQKTTNNQNFPNSFSVPTQRHELNDDEIPSHSHTISPSFLAKESTRAKQTPIIPYLTSLEQQESPSFTHRFDHTSDAVDNTSSAFNANAELISLESDFQARLLRFETERDVLRRKVAMLERDKKQNESLILEMAKKINESEERAFKLERENKKNASQVMSLKSQILGIKKLRSHFVDLGLVKDDPELRAMMSRAPFDPLNLRSRSNSETRGISGSNVRERTRHYMNDLDFKKNENGTVKTRSKSKSKTRKNSSGTGKKRTKSRSRSRSRSASVTTGSTSACNSTAGSTPTLQAYENESSRGRSLSRQTTSASNSHIPETTVTRNSAYPHLSSSRTQFTSKLKNLGHLPPAKAVLLAKLEDVDYEIDALAKELMLY